jgi:branched-chain amino acid transport system substrate-binding protein
LETRMTASATFRTSALIAALMAAGAASSVNAADIKLGAAEALSGPAGQYGQSIRNGFQLALDEINEAGGVKGNKLSLQIEDEQGKKEQAIDVFKKLIFQDKVLMVFGPTLSNSAQAADPIAQAAKIVAFGTSNTADGITSIGDYVFRNSVTEADVLPETLRVSIKHANIKKVAVLYGNDDVFTKSGYDAFKKALDDLKVPVTTTETFAKGDVDFKAQLTKIKASGADAIVLSALIAEGAPIMVQARQLGMDIPVIGGNGMNSVKIFDLAKEKSDNLWVGSPWALGSQTKENQHFVVAYTQKYKAAPDQFGAQAYDAVNIVATALGKVKLSGNLEADRKTLRDALPSVTHTGATGAFKFRQAMTKDGKPAGYDAQQAAIVSVTKAGKYSIEK